MTTEIKQVKTLEINQDLQYQTRSWMLQRVSWGVIAFTALMALLGLFGSGPISQTQVGDEGDRLWVKYERFGRFQSPTKLQIHLAENTGRGNTQAIWLNRDYLEEVEIERIIPEPDRVEAGSDRLIFIFHTESRNQPTTITFNLQPEKMGSLPGQVGLREGESLQFHQFIYP